MARKKRTPVDPALERQLAVDLFNHVWTLLEQEQRTRDEDDEMLHAAHASRHHWGEVGTAANRARGEWQVSRVYATLGRAEPAVHHAQRCLEVCREAPEEMADFDLPYAYEALARVHALGGARDDAERYAGLAREAGARITDEDDRRLLEADLSNLDV